MRPSQRTGLPSSDFIRPEDVVVHLRGIGDHRQHSSVWRQSQVVRGKRHRSVEIHRRRTPVACLPPSGAASYHQQKKRGGQQPTRALPSPAPGRNAPRFSRLRASLGDPLQFVADITGCLPSFLWLLGETFFHYAVQRRRRHRLKRRHGGRFAFQYRRNQTRLALSLKRPLARRHLVHHRAKRKDVGARIHFLVFELFRGHVLHCSYDGPLRRQRVVHRGKLRKRHICWCNLLLQFCQAEVEQLCPRLREHDVARLQVAMRDASSVRLVQRVGDFDRILQHLLNRQRAFHQALRQCLPLDIFHHQKICVVLMAGIVERADVRMIQAGNGFRFALEALAQFRAFREMRRQNFDRDNSVEARIAGFVYFAHAARANRREDFVWP